MKYILSLFIVAGFYGYAEAQPERLLYHDIKTDRAGKIIPWFSELPGVAYNHVINLVWSFWDTMRTDMNGLPYYMNHQVWHPDVNDRRGIGGDQLQMALSSWRLLYQYTGNERIKENMKFIADYYITHGMSSPDARWPRIPYPYNTLVYSGYYDGDMVIGKGFTQPDKAGSLGIELINLYKITGTSGHGQTPMSVYLKTAVKIANTLAQYTTDGDENNSPLPFKVNALTGEPGLLLSNTGDNRKTQLSTYTTNWAGTMELFLELIKMNEGDIALYQSAFDKILAWMKKYPLANNKWGPFFEDVPGWSDTQINAVTFAQFIMNHREYFPDWKNNVKSIFNWVYKTLGNSKWEKYGVVVINEQTAYMAPGNSHTARQASAELQYIMLTGDTTGKENAIHQLNWATYMVNNDGKNRYLNDDVWLTDGYGDYVRHYLRAMAAMPELAMNGENHILYSSSVVQNVEYNKRPGKGVMMRYTSYDRAGTEKVYLTERPSKILVEQKEIFENKDIAGEGFTWVPLNKGGVLTINRLNGNNVAVAK